MDQRSFESTFLYYLQLLNKWKTRIAAVIIVSVFIVLAVVLCLPRSYSAAVTFLLPYSNKTAISSIASSFGIPSLNTGELSSDVILAMTYSRRMAENIAQKFFHEEWSKASAKNREIHIIGIKRMINVFVPRGGASGTIEVTASNPKLAADIANFCIANLDQINQELNITPDRPIVKVIDAATPPSSPSSRNLIRKVMVTAFLSGGLMFLTVFFKDYCSRLFKSSNS